VKKQATAGRMRRDLRKTKKMKIGDSFPTVYSQFSGVAAGPRRRHDRNFVQRTAEDVQLS